jgi:hypothetical protein
MTNPFQSPTANLELSTSAENNSGGGSSIDIPPGVKGWSWGAFLLNWIWAVSHKTWIGLLCLVPYIGFIFSIYLGLKGRELAWRNKRWEDLEHFNRVQKKWSVWGLIIVFGFSGLGILAAITIPAYQQYAHKKGAPDGKEAIPQSISDTPSQKTTPPTENSDIAPAERLAKEPQKVVAPLPSVPLPVTTVPEPVKSPPPQVSVPAANTESPTQEQRPPKHSTPHRNGLGTAQLSRCLDYQTNMEIAKCAERNGP